MKQKSKVGFIGVGLMGHGLAKNIALSGYPLMFLDHPGNQPVGDLRALGATSTGVIADIAAQNEVIMVCVTGSEQTKEVICAERGLSGGLGPGKIVVDCSTVEPHVTQQVAREVLNRGAQFVDAPLTRTPKEAEQGKANVMVGGDAAVLEQIRPILESFAENIFHAGGIGAGATLKLLHNYISLGNCVLLAEAVISARRSGVDMETFIEVLSTGGGDSVALKRITPYVLEGDAGNFRFSIANSAKDTAYYKSLADHLGVHAVAAEAVRQVFDQARAQGHGDRAVPELIAVLSGEA